jgi:peptide/nickel transport system permease protein
VAIDEPPPETPIVSPKDVPPPEDPVVAKARGRRPSPRVAHMKRTWYFLRRNTLAMVGLGIIVFFVLVAIYAAFQPIPWGTMPEYCATQQTDGAPNVCAAGYLDVCTYQAGTPSPGPGCYATPAGYPSIISPTLSTHPFGTGPLPLGSLTVGADSPYFFNPYTALVRGSDWTLLISITIVLGGALVGLFLGAISGFWGGAVDEGIMRLVDIFLSIPQILFVVIVVAVLSTLYPTIFGLPALDSRILLLIMAFLVTWWPFYARIVRGQVLVVREQKYVEAAQASGASRGRIVRKHIVPNSLYPVFIQMSLDVGTIPLLIGALVFLGFHLFPTPYFPEWGSVAALSVVELQEFLQTCQLPAGCIVPWWQLAFPGLALFLYAISVNFLSDGLRDALDPRLRR